MGFGVEAELGFGVAVEAFADPGDGVGFGAVVGLPELAFPGWAMAPLQVREGALLDWLPVHPLVVPTIGFILDLVK